MIIDCHGHYTTAPSRSRGGARPRSPRWTAPRPRRSDRRSPSATTSFARAWKGPAAAAARARDGPDPLLPAGDVHGPPHRDAGDEPRVVAPVQRPDPPRVHALPAQFRARVPAPAVHPRLARHLRPGAGALREGAGVRRLQPEPGSLRRPLEGPAAHRPLLVPALREAGGARGPGHGARERQLQPLLPRRRRALHQRRHDGLHAVPHLGPLQGLPDAQVRHSPRRRGRSLPLGALPGPRAGHGPPAAQGARCSTTCSSTPASTTSPESTCS